MNHDMPDDMLDTGRQRPTLLLVDDESSNLQLLRRTLQDEYRLLFAKNGPNALALAQAHHPDLVLLDIMMPDMSGYAVCEALKRQPETRGIPVIFVTALNDIDSEYKGLELGAVDYIGKPFSPPVVKARVRTHLSLTRMQELHDSRLSIMHSLGVAAEYRDNETGMHTRRIGLFSGCLARAAGYDEASAEQLSQAAPMHDVGKIGIPDAILLKPGKLDTREWAIMQQHPVIGARIIGEHAAGLLRRAATIALYHHEKWDGSGYPAGLAGTDIPRDARIVALVDVFDALTSERPYKSAWPVAEAVALIEKESGRHFDPELVEAFKRCLPEILNIRTQWTDEEQAIGALQAYA